MKKILFACLMALSVSGLFAQDLKKAKTFLDKNDIDHAKEQVEGVLAKNPADPEALYLKSKVYLAMSTNDQYKNSTPEPRSIAFESFKKALENDKTNKLQLQLVTDKYKPIFDMYSGYYDAGAAAFNAGATNNSKPEFEKAMNNFKNANQVGAYIHSQKWALSDLDTGLVLNIAKSALNAGQKEEAADNFRRLADAKVKGTQEGTAGYDLPYQWLTYYYKDKKDEANMLKYAALGQQLYPKDDYYDGVLLDYYRSKGDKPALFAKYNDVVGRYPDSLVYHFNYANDMFNYIYNSDSKTVIPNKDELLKNISAELQKAIVIKPTDVNTNWLYGQYYYNSGVELKDKANLIKSTKPDDVKAKAELNSQATASFKNAIPYLEKAESILDATTKKSDKSRYKSIVDLQQNIYIQTQQKDKQKAAQAKYDAADTKFAN